MKSGDRLYITVCTSTENNEVCAPTPFKTYEEADKDVEHWYDLTTEEYEEGGCEYSGNYNDGFAYVEHDGEIETCQIIEVVIP